MPASAQSPLDLISFDRLLTEEERSIRDVVKGFVDDRIRPDIADWFDTGVIPARELAKELGTLGVLGMHLEGYGCQGTSAVAYGLACTELEAGDSGIRSLVSVQGSLAMFAIHAFGSEEHKQQWLPGMAAGDLIGCFGLTDDWILNGSKMWITNGNVADVAVVWARTDDGIRGFVVPTASAGFTARLIHKKMSLRASVTSELIFEDLRLPADAVLPEVVGLRGPLSCLNEARFGIVFGTMGAARDCLETASTASSSTSRSPGSSSRKRSSPTWHLNWARACCSHCTSAG
jgi:glutaryl-CoA dehydrogenase